jgi:CRP/FNR family transcriptional regulator, anaerobic regulatory protein
MKDLLYENYEHLFERELLEEIIGVGHLKHLEEDVVLMEYDQNVKYMPLLLDGAIKILRRDEEGEELLLYYLERGDTCSMTLNCCLGNTVSEIKAVVEVDAHLILIPVEFMKIWIKKYDGWMKFVFESYHVRLNEMLSSIDNLAFDNLNVRVLKYLKDKAVINGSTMLELTHKEIASDLHSSRVVISRLLKTLERDGVIELSRNKIEIFQL